MKQCIKRIITFALAFLLLLSVPITDNPITVYADAGSMTDADAAGSTELIGGPTYRRNAFIFYCIDPKTNTQITETVCVTNNWNFTDRNGRDIPLKLLTSRYGYAPNDFTIGTPWNFGPFGDSGVGMGSELKEFLQNEYAPGKTNAYHLIESQTGWGWGSEMAEKYKAKKAYLVFEVVAGHHVYLNSTGTGIWIASTTYNLGTYQKNLESMGMLSTGDPKIAKYTNGVYTFCVMLEDCPEIQELGYIAGNGDRKTNAMMATKNMGNGIGIVWNAEDAQTTCDESLSSAHAAPNESVGTYTIVKNYMTKQADGTYIDNGCFIKSNVSNKILIEDESGSTGYRLAKYIVSSSAGTSISAAGGQSAWQSNVPATHLFGSTVQSTVDLMDLNAKSVYVLLIKEDTDTPTPQEYDFLIPQAALTRQIRFTNLAKTAIVSTTNFKWSSSGHKTSCSGHSWSHSSGCKNGSHSSSCSAGCTSSHKYCPGHTDYCTWGQWDNIDLNFGLKNAKVSENTNLVAQVGGWNLVTTPSTTTKRFVDNLTRSTTDADSKEINGWDYVSVLWRGQDKLTIAQWKNTSAVNNLMTDIGFSVANSPAGSRKTLDYYDTFNTRFVSESPDVTTTYKITQDSGHGACSPDSRSYALTNPLEINGLKVLIKVYSGKPAVGAQMPPLKSTNQADLGSLTFYPYIKMTYDTQHITYEANHGQTAYVLGNYSRTLKFRNYIKVEFPTDTSNNSLEIASNQWSTHVGTNENLANKLGDNDPKKIIPGGTTLSLKQNEGAPNKGIKDIVVTTYQVILEGDGKTQVDYTGSVNGDFTEATAISRHNSAANNVESALESLRVELYGNTNPKQNPFSGTNITKDKRFNGQDISTAEKYNWDDFLETYLDAQQEPRTATKYVFKTDTEGNVWMDTNLILSKGSNIGSISGDAKTINDYTDVVNQLANGLERNTGDDLRPSWGGTWYNEAFDGVTVLVSKTTIHTGIWDPAERNTVFDPKLTPNQSSKGDLGTAFYSFQMKTAPASDNYPSKNNQVATFMNKVVLTSQNLNEMFITDRWYSSNITGQDLH